MTLTGAQIAEIERRAEAERARDGYPAGVPALPPVPAARYGDPGFAALEQEAVFGRSWLMVAHSDEVRSPGDYLVVEQLALPVVLVRGCQERRIYHVHEAIDRVIGVERVPEHLRVPPALANLIEP